MSIDDRLDEIQARADNATDGPWQVSPDGPAEGYAGPIYTESEFTDVPELVSDGTWLPNAEFIAHARTDVPALVAALQAVLDLHPPNDIIGHVTCDRCRDLRGNQVEYPCPTVRAVEAALGGTQ